MRPRPEPWTSWRGARANWRIAVEGWRAVPVRHRTDWARAVAFGFAISLLVAAAMTLGVRRLASIGSLLERDEQLLRRLADWPAFSFFDAMWVDAFGTSAVVVPVGLLAVVLAARAHRPIAAATVIIAYLGARPLKHVGWSIWDRSRPELIAGAIAHPPGSPPSFPSGHVLNIVVIYGLFVMLWVRSSRSALERLFAGLLLLAVIAVGSLARVRLGAHWPSDAMGSVIIGTVWVAVLVRALQRAES